MNDIVPTLVLVFIWNHLYLSSPNHGGYTLPDIIQYYFLVIIIRAITASHFDEHRSEQVREGKIDHFLIRPFSFFWEIVIGVVAARTFYMLLSFPLLLLSWTVVAHFLSLSFVQPSFLQFLVFLTLLLGAVILDFIFSLLVVLLSFWFEGAEGLAHFKWLAINIFSGWMIPIYLMPHWLQAIVQKLPFKYMYAIPIEVIQGRMLPNISDWLFFGGFILLLALLSAFLWRKAMYRYASAGGWY